MNVATISKWLRKTPQPAAVVVDDTKKIDVPNKGGRWTEIARTIEALGASKLTALDGQGNVIRALTISEDDDAPESKTELQSDLQALSKIIADAYEKGTQAPSKLMESAMTFIERQGQRLVAQDREIERLRALNARLSAEIMQLKSLPIEAEGDDGILTAVIQGMAQGQMAAAAGGEEPPPNGKGGRK